MTDNKRFLSNSRRGFLAAAGGLAGAFGVGFGARGAQAESAEPRLTAPCTGRPPSPSRSGVSIRAAF